MQNIKLQPVDTTHNKRRVFLYRRVSSAEQVEGSSLQEQHRVNEQFCEGKGHQVVGTFEDVQTAAKVGRRQFDEMVRKLKRGEADGLVFHKVDRSTRNYRDWAVISKLMDAGYYIAFASEHLESSETGGRLTMDLLVAMAVHYVRNLRDETKKGLRGRVRDGYWPWNAPLGYRDRDKTAPDEERCIKYVDKEKAPHIKRLFELYAERRYTFMELAAEMNERGFSTRNGMKICHRRIAKILTNPFYAGFVTYEGHVFRGVHEPIISVDLWKRVEELRSSRSRTKKTKYWFLFRQLLRCGYCGLFLVGEVQKGHTYYRCHHHGSHVSNSIRETEVVKQIAELLSRANLGPAERELVQALLSSESNERVHRSQKVVATERLKRGKLEAKKKKALEAFLAGVLNENVYKSVELEVVTKIAKLDEEAAARAEAASPGDMSDILDLLEQLDSAFLNGAPEYRRDMLLALFSNLKIQQKQLEAQPRKWLEVLLSRKNRMTGAPTRDLGRTLASAIICDADVVRSMSMQSLSR